MKRDVRLRGDLWRDEVRDVMTPGVVVVPEDATLADAARALVAHQVHAILVVSVGNCAPLGWITAESLRGLTDRDRSVARAGGAVVEGVTGIDPGASTAAARAALALPGVTRLAVRHRDRGLPLGVVTDFDLVES